MKQAVKLVVVALCLGSLILGCGGGTTFIFSFHSGTISGSPSCGANGGQFNLNQQGGLLVLVVITSNSTIILSNGSHGTCRDLSTNTPVVVNGQLQGDRITARTVTVQPT